MEEFTRLCAGAASAISSDPSISTSMAGASDVLSRPAAGQSSIASGTSGSEASLLVASRSNTGDLDDASSVGSNDALHPRVQLKSGLSSPHSSVSGSGAARRGTWRAVGSGMSSRSYAHSQKTSSDLSPSLSDDGHSKVEVHDVDNIFGMAAARPAGSTDADAIDDDDDDDDAEDREAEELAETRQAWGGSRQPGFVPPGSISYLPALSLSSATTTEDSASASADSKSASTPSTSAETVPSATGVDVPTEPAGDYDWANFVFAYSRGRWNPGVTPQPPSQSTLHAGASVRITHITDEPSGTLGDDTKPRRPSLEYIMPLSSENVQAVPIGSLLPSLDPQSVPDDRDWSDHGETRAASSSPLPEPSKRSVEHLPQRATTPPTLSAMTPSTPSQSQLFAALQDPSTSSSAVQQLPKSRANVDASSSWSTHEAQLDHVPVRSHTAPGGGGSVSSQADHGSPDKAAALRPDPSVWETPKVTKAGMLASDAASKQPAIPNEASSSEPFHVSFGLVGSDARPGLATQISHLELEPGIGNRSGESYDAKTTKGARTESGAAESAADAGLSGSTKGVGEDPTTPTRPGPTPVQRSSAGPPLAWASAPDGLPGLAKSMSRQNSSSIAPREREPTFAMGLSAEIGTVAGLRRAARRTSIERGEMPIERRPKAEHLKLGPVPHSASFPGNSPRSSAASNGRPMEVPHLSSIGREGSSHSHGGMQAMSTGMPPFISVAHYVKGKPTGGTRIDLRGNVSSPPRPPSPRTVGSPGASSSSRKANSPSVTMSRMRPKLGTTRSQRISAYLAAGRRVETFFREHGYMPFVPPPNETDRLQALHRYGPPKIAGNPNFERIAHLVKLVFNTKLVLITLVGQNEQIIQTEMGGGGEVTIASLQDMAGPRNCSFCSHAILQDSDEPMVVLDASRDWRFAGNPLVQGSPDIRFYAGSPLRTSDGQNIGSLCLIDDRPRSEFGPRQRHTLKEFARVVMREMELLRDKIQLSMRDRMQRSIELFTKDCLEMDSEEGDGDSASTPQENVGTHKVFHQAAESLRSTLQVSGAVIFDLSHFELIDSYESGCAPSDLDDGTGSRIYFSNPVQPSLSMSDHDDGGDKTPGITNEGGHGRPGSTGIDGTTGFETFSPFTSPTDENIRGREVPPMSVLGASEMVAPPPERTESVPLAHHVKVAEFLRLNKMGRFYPFAPPPFRSLLPPGVTSLLLVPIFGLNKQPFALLCAYSTSSATGPALEEIQGFGLQYIRALGMIVLGAVLKKDITLADKAKSHFISNISHELRTPLHGILAAAELLAETKMNATQGSYLETVEACGKSLLELVNHVLDFTKLSGNSRQGQKHMHTKTKCDMVKLIQEVAESSWIGQMAKQLDSAQSGIGSVYAPPKGEDESAVTLSSSVQAKAKHAKNSQVETVIDISMRPDGWLVNCDTGGIRRVLMNLIGNSLKFTAAGYVHVSLREVQSSDTHVLVELAVIDTGRGISRAFLEEQLFHPFTQENPLGTGTGLGLSIVNSIVQSPALNGKIDVWSTEGQGTEIRVTCELELCDDEGAEGPIYKPAINVGKKHSVALLGFGNSRGDEDLRAAIEGYFYTWWEFTVVEQESATSFKYGDLVLVNDNMAVMEQIAADRKGDLPPVIFLTGGRGDAEIAAACEAYHSAGGVARILFKPAGPSKLESVVDFCLQCMDRKRSGDPPCSEETKPSTPLPSPSQSPAARLNIENGDTYFFPSQARSDRRPSLIHGTESFESSGSQITPRAEALTLEAGEAFGAQPYHMSPGPPGPSTSLIRRHSTEDKVVRAKMEGTDMYPDTSTATTSKPSRPLLPARSITYHEPRLHKHVLMSPMAGPSPKRGDGDGDSYFDRSPASSSPNTPGSTISLEGGDGAVLRSAVSSSMARSVSGSQKRRLKILSVEDNAINRKVIAVFLTKLDVDFVEACNGEEGVKQFELHPPNHFDVILMDLSMPVMDGLSATAAIRKIEHERYQRAAAETATSSRLSSEGSQRAQRPNPPPSRPNARNRVKIFALTGRSTDADKRGAFQTGADGYIVKPLSFKVLSALLRMLQR